MPTAHPKTLEYAAGVTRSGRVEAEGCDPLELGSHWQAEHLVLAGLVRCSITSLRYHARRAGLTVEASGDACGRITKRESDGRYAFVDVSCDIEAEIAPPPAGDDLRELLTKTERDCFIGASMEIAPRYRWIVNGAEVA
jgi:organic hydroperoxide reductase OsmC/OhrA